MTHSGASRLKALAAHWEDRAESLWEAAREQNEYDMPASRESMAAKNQVERCLSELNALVRFSSLEQPKRHVYGDDEVCRCPKPAPLVPGAMCRKCHRWTVALVNEETGAMTVVPSNQPSPSSSLVQPTGHEPTPWTIDGSMPLPVCVNDTVRRADVVTMWNEWRCGLPADVPFRHSDGVAFLNKLNEIASASLEQPAPWVQAAASHLRVLTACASQECSDPNNCEERYPSTLCPRCIARLYIQSLKGDSE